MESIFTDKTKIPDNADLERALGETYCWWQAITDYVYQKYPQGTELWNCSKYGWSYRISDKKRAIVYLLPRDRFFKVAMVFGHKATEKVLQSELSANIKHELETARVYAEGRGIRIDIKDDLLINDIKTLIEIKLSN